MSKEIDISRRKLLGGLGVIGGAGALGGSGTAALFWDEEVFGDTDTPNVLQAGELDLKVDWEEHYVDWIGPETEYDAVMVEGNEVPDGYEPLPTPDNPMIAVHQDDIEAFMDATVIETSDDFDGPDDINASEEDAPHDLVDQPDPVITLQDVKPGDFGEVTLSYHLFGNPGFVTMCAEEIADSDNGITEPEDKVNGHEADDSDGTEGGDLGDHVQATAFYDPNCDNRDTGQDVEVMLATDVSESMDGNQLPGTPGGIDTDGGDNSRLEAIKAAVGDYDAPGLLSQLEGSCSERVRIGATSFSENLEHLDDDVDGDDPDDPYGNDADGQDAILDKALMPIGAENQTFPADENGIGDNEEAGLDNGGADEYAELKLLFGEGQGFADEDKFVVDDDSTGNPFVGANRYNPTIGGNEDYEIGNGNTTLVAERPYTGDGDSTQDDGAIKAVQSLLPDDEDFEWSDGAGRIEGIDPSGNAASPGDATKLIVYFTDGEFSGGGEDDPDPAAAQEISNSAETLGIEIKPVIVNPLPNDNDVAFAEALATSDREPVYVNHYDDPSYSCASSVTDAGKSCTTMVQAIEDCVTDICDSAGSSGATFAGPAPINQVIDEISDCRLVDPILSGSGQSAEFGGDCHSPSQTGCIALAWWLPRDIPGVNDNIIETDRYEFKFSFNAVQCRHNVTEDGEPIAVTPSGVDEQAGGET